MPSKKKKYNARFPAGRIKKIMQTDDEVGKVAQAVPIIISMQFTSAKNAKTLSPSHMKQCILSESRFDFLKDLVKGLPDISSQDDEVPTPPSTPSTPSVPLTPSLPLTTSQIIVTPTSTTVHSSTTQHTEIRAIKQMGSLSDKSVQDKNIKIVGREESVNLIAINEVKISPKSQVPEFQISVPPTFNINQPNFYTEVNPMNVNDNSNLKPTNQVTCNYAQSSNIDEDYDT